MARKGWLLLPDTTYGYGDRWARMRDRRGCALEVAERPAGTRGFATQPRCWVVEQSIACPGRDRRLARDYEYVNGSSETRALIAAIGLSL